MALRVEPVHSDPIDMACFGAPPLVNVVLVQRVEPAGPRLDQRSGAVIGDDLMAVSVAEVNRSLTSLNLRSAECLAPQTPRWWDGNFAGLDHDDAVGRLGIDASARARSPLPRVRRSGPSEDRLVRAAEVGSALSVDCLDGSIEAVTDRVRVVRISKCRGWRLLIRSARSRLSAPCLPPFG